MKSDKKPFQLPNICLKSDAFVEDMTERDLEKEEAELAKALSDGTATVRSAVRLREVRAALRAIAHVRTGWY
jgi:hypothetical protein